MVSDSEGVAAWAALLRVHAAVLPKLDEALQSFGLPITWYDVLLVLNAAPDRRLRMSELGMRAVVSRERASRVVGELASRGMVVRQANPEDGRSFFAVITDEGRARLKAAAPTYLKAVEAHFAAHLSESEKRTVAKALGRVLKAEEPFAGE